MNKNRFVITLTIDVEDWPQSTWDRSMQIRDYCADDTRRLLEIMAKSPEARGTFFVLGKFAEKHPGVVKDILEAGHEVASHGWGHVEVFHFDKNRFREDIKRSTEAIADAAGVQPIGYRAPDFSIVGETLWALEILAKKGYKYDSSIFPIKKNRYGIAGWPREAVEVKLKSGDTITEFPLTTLDLWRWHIPIGGGGYARLIPGGILVRAFRKVQTQINSPPVFYCHPYELNWREFEKIDFKIPLKVRLHQSIGRKRTSEKLHQILKNFECIPLCEAKAKYKNLKVINYTDYTLNPNSVIRPPAFEGGTIMPKE